MLGTIGIQKWAERNHQASLKRGVEEARLLQELNALDRFAHYYPSGQDENLQVTYMSHFYEMTKPEARRHLNFLRMIRGVGSPTARKDERQRNITGEEESQ